MREYEYEPVRGLPEELPPDEHIVWQGEPSWPALANRVFHVRTVTLYFLALIAVHVIYQMMNGSAPADIALAVGWQFALSAVALGLLSGAGWLYARNTVYTFTNKRLVLRSGVALPMMVNLPWHNVEKAGLRVCSDGTGDILLSVSKSQRLYRMMLWPHVRPWHFSQAQPLLRGIPEPVTVARLLATAVRDQAAQRHDGATVETGSLTTHEPGEPAYSGQTAAAN